MKKKTIFLIIMMLILLVPNIIFAFAEELIDNPTPSVPEDISTMTSKILGVIQWAGYAIAVGMLLYIGIKYMMSAANEKASLKQSLINYFIGAVVLVSVVTIFTAVVGFFNGGETSTENTETEQSTGGGPIVNGGTLHTGGGSTLSKPTVDLH